MSIRYFYLGITILDAKKFTCCRDISKSKLYSNDPCDLHWALSSERLVIPLYLISQFDVPKKRRKKNSKFKFYFISPVSCTLRKLYHCLPNILWRLLNTLGAGCLWDYLVHSTTRSLLNVNFIQITCLLNIYLICNVLSVFEN